MSEVTETATPVVVKGNASFDDMDFIQDETPVQGKPQTKIDEEMEVPVEEKPMTPEVLDAEKKEEVKEEGKTDDKKDEKVSKKIKAKSGDQELDLDPDVLVPVTIDGKEEMVKLSDIRNQYSGKMAIEKRFSEIDKEKKAFTKEKQTYDEKFNKTKEFFQTLDQKLEAENPYEALDFLLEKGGKSSYDFKYNKLLPAMMDEVTQLLQMDEVSREAYLAKKENEYLKKGRESEELKSKQEQSKTEFIAKVDAMRETHKISEDEYVKAHQDLLEMGKKDFKPDNVIDYVRNLRSINKSIELVKSIDPSKAENEDVIKSVASTLKNHPEVTEQDIVDELRQYWSLPAQKTEEIGKKVQDTRSQPKKTVRGFESFDDYEN